MSLAGRVLEPNEPKPRQRDNSDDEIDDDALFAELEAEIENDNNSAMREQGLELFRKE